MSTIREAILERSRLSRMRLGQEAPEMVEIPSMPEIRCAQVPLTEAETHKGIMAAAKLEVEDNFAGMNARNRVAMQWDVWQSLREPDDPGKYVFPSVQEMVATLEPSDIDVLADSLTMLMEYASPALDGMTDEELSGLKKAFNEIDWSVLSGRQWAAVKLACQALFPELLQVRSSGSSSTDSSTTTNEDSESTPDA